ncbi:hypothetical protein MJO28_004219 [Puccinia striiformis f. sp. tritici]|uniref:Uncharacterized protein n=1 Tax=Puccinia striiformis f. sp. tritici TaxID=168172 RepID=A0ACC0ENB6_9BASI|nr:hypothetical protein MJO28_004219 [Puccinia striiformis f. sp. tritici]KAI7963644.1 hypothetical protein MJO29_004071 [Puccinia striiformis f. sp. tritici]
MNIFSPVITLAGRRFTNSTTTFDVPLASASAPTPLKARPQSDILKDAAKRLKKSRLSFRP